MPLRSLTRAQYLDNAQFKAFQDSLFDDYPLLFNNQPDQLFRPQLIPRIKEAEVNGQRIADGVWLIDNSARRLLKNIIKKAWAGDQLVEGDVPAAKNSDIPMIELIRNYIRDNELCLFVPRFYCSKKLDDSPSVYRLEGYDWKPFLKSDNNSWEPATVDRFIDLLLLGGHFVTVHSKDDLGTANPSFFDAFKAVNGVRGAKHSHYTGHLVSLNGKNYPNLTLSPDNGGNLDKLTNVNDACIIPVILCDTTANSKPNSFFQLEGWAPGAALNPFTRGKAFAGGYRHGADFMTHGNTIWNISTYGASPFSEKRGGTIFLAPKKWSAKTTMKAYRGFGSVDNSQRWFQSQLLE